MQKKIVNNTDFQKKQKFSLFHEKKKEYNIFRINCKQRICRRREDEIDEAGYDCNSGFRQY